MRVTFKFADGRDREEDPPATSGLPMRIKMVETVERVFELNYVNDKPCYIEIAAAGRTEEGPIGSLVQAILRYMWDYAEENKLDKNDYNLISALDADIRAGEFFRKAPLVIGVRKS